MKYKMALPFFLYNLNMEKTEGNKLNSRYRWWRDKKMIGTIIIITSLIAMIFVFVKVPFMSTINGYTIGMIMGWYSPLFYVYIIYMGLIMVFGDKIKLPKWIKLNTITYSIVVVSIIFISTSTGYYQSKSGFTSIGAAPWKSFSNWFDSFTDDQAISAWTPVNTNGGLIGVFLYSIVASMASGIGALIVSIGVLVITVSIIISGSTIGLYKEMISKRKVDLKQKEIKDDKLSDISEFEIKDKAEDKQKKDNSLPFDDPFDI